MDEAFLDPQIEALIRTGEAYVELSFGFRMNLRSIGRGKRFDVIENMYEILLADFQEKSVIMAYYRGNDEDIVDRFIEFRSSIASKFDEEVIICLMSSISTLMRREMVENRIGFFVPGSQIYIPDLFLDLKDRPGKARVVPAERISPLAQLIILAVLLGENLEGANLTELAERCRVSVMSASRVMDELEELGVARGKFVGRQRCLHMPVSGRLLWDAVKDRLRAPLRKIRSIKGELPEGVTRISGRNALAFYAGMPERGATHYAMSEALFNRLEKNAFIEPADFRDEDRIEIEAWSYDPCVLAREGFVDPLSLYLNYRDDRDGEIEQNLAMLLNRLAR